ncbi:MAG: GDSL-type esterase/lipase family protein [Bergeyella sp.]
MADLTDMKRIFLIFLALFSVYFQAQQSPFWNEIQHFKQLDKDTAPPKNAILLIGSSSFTMWKDVADYFPGKVIINRGFGGSSLKDLNRYSTELLEPYHPKQILIYCGENDFASDASLTSKDVFKRYKTFYKAIREYYPDIPVAYISIKMSPSRENLWKQFQETNARIKKFMKNRKNAEYIDITKPMEDAFGNVRNDLFLEDMLHMKPEGYRIWTEAMMPYMK